MMTNDGDLSTGPAFECYGRQADYFPDDAFICEECSDPVEAQNIADLYQRIIANIERQLDQQGGF